MPFQRSTREGQCGRDNPTRDPRTPLSRISKSRRWTVTGSRRPNSTSTRTASTAAVEDTGMAGRVRHRKVRPSVAASTVDRTRRREASFTVSARRASARRRGESWNRKYNGHGSSRSGNPGSVTAARWSGLAGPHCANATRLRPISATARGAVRSPIEARPCASGPGVPRRRAEIAASNSKKGEGRPAAPAGPPPRL